MTGYSVQKNLKGTENDFKLGIEGFSFADLFTYEGLKRLYRDFIDYFDSQNPSLCKKFIEYRNGEVLFVLEESNLLIKTAKYLNNYIGRLFKIEDELHKLEESTLEQKALFKFKKDFFQKRILKKFNKETLNSINTSDVQSKINKIIELFFFNLNWNDEELSTAILANELEELEKAYKDKFEPFGLPKEIPIETTRKVKTIIDKLSTENLFADLFEKPIESELEQYEFLKKLLNILDKWIYSLYALEENKRRTKSWVIFKMPETIDYFKLVNYETPDENFKEILIGREENYRRRDGFKLTDNRYTERQVEYEVDYCILCHERDKDYCSKGYPDKDGKIKSNPLGIKLTGCPLGQKISEAHTLKTDGLTLGALAMIMLDNPLLPGTGHRICNDCMKSCIYQKQEPVNIPQIETRILTDILNLPYGFEIYHLLTRWNPLNIKRPYELPNNGRKVLVVGLGPAGYCLAHYLSNEGFGVVGIDGLKIEPMPKEYVGDENTLPKPLKYFNEIYKELDERIMMGFGGVSEYGITVRWDKNFLSVIYLSLLRKQNVKFYGGIRFGGTIDIDDAWQLGFDHIAIATGAGKPTFLNIKNNLSRGIRKASDFLMALQLTGAAKKSSMANLQIRLPALVVGGGLTAIDTATELMAYYPMQVEKYLHRYEKIVQQFGEDKYWSMLNDEEKIIANEFIEHGREVRSERQRAEQLGEKPNFIPLIRKWGDVKIIYRKSMLDSPAYRLNHEEIIKAFEEGVTFVEKLNPIEAILDEFNSLKAVKCIRQEKVDGKWKDTDEEVILDCRSMLVAAGTSPNIVYEKEYPGTFELDEWNYFFQSHKLDEGIDDVPTLVKTEKGEIGFFTSYEKDGKFVTFYGDNHPQYSGNVVKAMASAKIGYTQIAKLFENDIEASEKNYEKNVKSFKQLIEKFDNDFVPIVKEVVRLTPTITELIVHAPQQARKFQPGQFFRLQNYEIDSPFIDDTKLTLEGIALTGAWVDKENGLLSLIVLELGSSSRLIASLKPGQKVVVMGPTGTPTEITENKNVMLVGGGLGNAVLFSIAKAMKEKGNKIIYFAGYKKPEDVYKMEEIERSVDQVIWATDIEPAIKPRRPQDLSFVGNIVQCMLAYAQKKIGGELLSLDQIDRIIAIGSDRMMGAVKEARHTVLKPYLKDEHVAIG
ncbi:MAG: FAD-dependent oxidoreductase, partial [Ignavibacteria bacterium]|nr:FAD-dependent oxidoreductase [Ignavibacteria bacterium]